MKYVALLRGINVGGNAKVAMIDLRRAFKDLGFANVITYINSGNVLFEAEETQLSALTAAITAALKKEFGFAIKVLVITGEKIITIVNETPNSWQNDQYTKTDVLFLFDELNNPEIIKTIGIRDEIEQAIYIDGAVIWSAPRKNVGKSNVLKLVGTPLYKQMTVRNINTARKLALLLS